MTPANEMWGQTAEAYPSIPLPAPNDDKSLFGTGQAGQVWYGASIEYRLSADLSVVALAKLEALVKMEASAKAEASNFSSL